MSPKKWIETTNAIGIVSKAGRYGGTYAHSDIAMSFANWISPEFQLYIMKDYRRLNTDENSRLSLNWNLNREISKLSQKERMELLRQLALQQLQTLETVRYNLFWDNTPFCTMLFIDEDYQGKGYGMLLTSTQVDEEAQHFYRKLGYKDCGGFVIDVAGYEQPMELFLIKSI